MNLRSGELERATFFASVSMRGGPVPVARMHLCIMRAGMGSCSALTGAAGTQMSRPSVAMSHSVAVSCWVSPEGGDTAIDDQRGAGHERRIVAGEEERGSGEFVDMADALDRHTLDDAARMLLTIRAIAV